MEVARSLFNVGTKLFCIISQKTAGFHATTMKLSDLIYIVTDFVIYSDIF